MKRVLILNYEYPPLGGGAATATYNLLQQLKNKNELAIILLTSSVSKYVEEKIGKNIKIVKIDIKKNNHLQDQSNTDLMRFSWKALEWMTKHRKEFDIIHAFFGIPCGFLAMLIGKPYIVSLRGSDVPFYSDKYKFLDKYIFQHLDKLVWKRAKYLVANSEGLRDLAYKTYNKKEIMIIYNGVDTEKFTPMQKNSKFIVVSTSRLIERKGLKYLINAFIEFSKGKKEVELILYGDGVQREELEKLAGKWKDNKIKFLGETSRDKLAENIPLSSVFVLPSLNEGMSNSLLEAMASGLAIIATDVGGSKELIDDKNGIIVERKNEKAIINALNKIYKNRFLLKCMSEESRKKAIIMNWSKMAEKYCELYYSI